MKFHLERALNEQIVLTQELKQSETNISFKEKMVDEDEKCSSKFQFYLSSNST